MNTRTSIAGLPGLITGLLLVVGCSEATGPSNAGTTDVMGPSFAVAAQQNGITRDQDNGSLGYSGLLIRKGFNPTSPHHGDAIIATFFWLGSTNIIDSVTDVLTDANFTPVGNKFTLVEYVTAGGISMATYVATNVQNFPDPNPGDVVYAVQANLREPITDGGVKLSAWGGVDVVTTQPVGAHRSASGSGSTGTVAGAGPVAIGAGSLAYAVTMSNAVVSTEPPAGFTSIGGAASDQFIREDGQYLVSGAAGTVDPRWTWNFTAPSTWLASSITLNPAPHLSFSVQPSTTLPFTTIQPAVQVTVLDALGTRATTFNGPVTISIGRNGGLLVAGTLSGTLTVNAVNGVATFSSLSIDQPGSGYTLVVNAASVSGGESAPFNIGAF
ncbi:MAG TPA: hypothetical protein VGQ18_10985 [Gemmatimonadales bacterium]|jgi:hypothetical protein|nr:hypothetical protein [Gemmatimonadales bacterium]